MKLIVDLNYAILSDPVFDAVEEFTFKFRFRFVVILKFLSSSSVLLLFLPS